MSLASPSKKRSLVSHESPSVSKKRRLESPSNRYKERKVTLYVYTSSHPGKYEVFEHPDPARRPRRTIKDVLVEGAGDSALSRVICEQMLSLKGSLSMSQEYIKELQTTLSKLPANPSTKSPYSKGKGKGKNAVATFSEEEMRERKANIMPMYPLYPGVGQTEEIFNRKTFWKSMVQFIREAQEAEREAQEQEETDSDKK
eukprot:GILI01022256.1.p1 GENE.GILI01022256.1~~GILI01022256.1.p1  ORF type:complete len:217 (-),score=16.01 GILI01022256.1:580-1179(-)